MANKKKSETVEAKPTKVKEDNVSKENEALKAQIEAMQAQMKALMENMAKPEVVEAPKPKKESKTIKFVNLTKGSVVLKGSQFWRIEKQFASRSFSEREARVIVSNMNNFVRSGAVFITDAQFVEDNDLADSYENIISDKKLMNLLNQHYSDVIETYNMASDEQKKIIVDMIIEKREKGVAIDGNILMEIGRLSGKDLMSIEKEED